MGLDLNTKHTKKKKKHTGQLPRSVSLLQRHKKAKKVLRP